MSANARIVRISLDGNLLLDQLKIELCAHQKTQAKYLAKQFP